jgi:hypothetical protein
MVRFDGKLLFCILLFGFIVIAIFASRDTEQKAAAAGTQTAAVLQRLHGGDRGDPATFWRYCGNPDHVRKASRDSLTWVYESKAVMLTFVKRQKVGEPYGLVFSDYDPALAANWGEYRLLAPEAAISRLGCSVPAN